MVCNFVADEEKGKNLLKRKDVTKMMIQGLETDAYYCDDCKLVMPVIR